MNEAEIAKIVQENLELKLVLRGILTSLPVARDWLDPMLERVGKELVELPLA